MLKMEAENIPFLRIGFFLLHDRAMMNTKIAIFISFNAVQSIDY